MALFLKERLHAPMGNRLLPFRFRGYGESSVSEAGSYFKAHRLLYHSTLGLRAIKKRKKVAPDTQPPPPPMACQAGNPNPYTLNHYQDGNPYPDTLNPKTQPTNQHPTP